ncbi:hypothetical protein BO70DRAFT_282331, partial [Aspergillus heteromorphus CBS 117.55]
PTVNYDADGEDRTLLPQDNRNGWVNPEDLSSMPQCIAQQDQSAWLDTMTECTGKRCTFHLGVICAHYQWLTQLSCLSTAFSSDVITSYFPYCDRSILAKAQLYQWIRNITGRTWLVDVGDTNSLQHLSPASLAKGYAALDVIDNAPKCLTDSTSASLVESFQHVIASCSFTGTTRHTGNAARPWEYSESLRSMVALDFETVGYDLVQHRISDDDYFDQDCFCSAFTIDFTKEPCSESDLLDLTKERVWMNATCGSTSLPDHWTDTLKTTQFAYIPIENWDWPMCVADMPEQAIQLTDQCATDACDIDSSGYCKVRRAVDRACFCRNISYDSCGGSCQVFETRIDYIKWLHGLCGNVHDWHGLPDHWRQLAVPTPSDMIPWGWTLKPSIDSDIANTTRLGSFGVTEPCASNEWKLGSFALVHIATFLAALLGQKISIHDQIARGFLGHSHPWSWFSKGILIAALQLLAHWSNSLIVQTTPGYKDTPVIQLMLLWSSMPRLAWLPILLIGLPSFEAMKFSTAASLLFAETILQCISSYYMFMTVNYGREHNFYLGGIEGAERAKQAKAMYAGALMWLVIIIITVVQLTRAKRKTDRLTRSGRLDPQTQPIHYRQVTKITTLPASLNDTYTRPRENLPAYNQINNDTHHFVSQKQVPFVRPYASTVRNIFLLWVAQWIFWGGFVGLASDEYVIVILFMYMMIMLVCLSVLANSVLWI